jgi:uncharacterized protein
LRSRPYGGATVRGFGWLGPTWGCHCDTECVSWVMQQPSVPQPLSRLMAQLSPLRRDETYVYAVISSGAVPDGLRPVVTVRETEGLTVIVSAADAHAHNLHPLFRCVWITLTVESALDAHGLTAAFATALANAGIACNVVAGAHHDHLFVPEVDGDAAMAVLLQLQADAANALDARS